jgi:hypothetical protein
MKFIEKLHINTLKINHRLRFEFYLIFFKQFIKTNIIIISYPLIIFYQYYCNKTSKKNNFYCKPGLINYKYKDNA